MESVKVVLFSGYGDGNGDGGIYDHMTQAMSTITERLGNTLGVNGRWQAQTRVYPLKGHDLLGTDNLPDSETGVQYFNEGSVYNFERQLRGILMDLAIDYGHNAPFDLDPSDNIEPFSPLAMREEAHSFPKYLTTDEVEITVHQLQNMLADVLPLPPGTSLDAKDMEENQEQMLARTGPAYWRWKSLARILGIDEPLNAGTSIRVIDSDQYLDWYNTRYATFHVEKRYMDLPSWQRNFAFPQHLTAVKATKGNKG
jgi:hypothetical protein